MSRIFQQFGHGYGAVPVSIVAQVDGNTVFSGTVPTDDAPVPGGGPSLGLLCFDWTEPVTNFVGTKSFSISVINGVFQTGPTLAQSNVGNADQYGPVYLTNINNTVLSDPLSQVSINDAARARPYDTPLTGQWGWTLQAGDTLTATLNVNMPAQHASIASPWNIADSYQGGALVRQNSVAYLSLQAVPAGVDITDIAYWLVTPVATWSPSISYASGYFVVQNFEAGLYKSLQNVPEGTSLTDAAYWQRQIF